jgi:hypothetical protein
MTVEEIRKELETIITALTGSGFDSIDSGIPEKLDKLATAADEAGLKEGKHLIENLSGAMKAIQEGKSKPESGGVRLTALEFYVKKLTDTESTEEL